MAHFAQLDENNIVTQVIVINNKELEYNGKELEAKGIAFCQYLFPNTKWKQTSYNGSIRKNYASIGFKYDPIRDAFIAPKPFDSWLLDEQTCTWYAPIPYPNDNKVYVWDESILNWKEI